MTWAILVLALVTAQRLGELWLSARNTRALLARGGTEVAPEHFPVIVAVHAAWLAGLWVLAWDAAIETGWLAVFMALQGLRIWVMASLGARWTTRIIVLPGVAKVRRGPYRALPHPNYAVVACEIAVLPLAFGLPTFAALFSVANAVILFTRIDHEARALDRAH